MCFGWILDVLKSFNWFSKERQGRGGPWKTKKAGRNTQKIDQANGMDIIGQFSYKCNSSIRASSCLPHSGTSTLYHRGWIHIIGRISRFCVWTGLIGAGLGGVVWSSEEIYL